MRWPLALRSTVDKLRLRLVALGEENRELRAALGATQVELRKHRMLLAGRYETLRNLGVKPDVQVP